MTMWVISYWIFPLFSALVWLAMLLTMLLYWIANGSRRFPSMEPGQHIAYATIPNYNRIARMS